METECDFMEIDNNIAARLQVSSVQRPKSSELPESLPVPMLANFGHFEETDEKESSFMTTNEDKNASGETEASADEPTPGLLPANTQREEELRTDNVEAGVSKASSENPELGGDSTQNVTDRDADFEADDGKPFLNIGDLHHSINPIGSNPLFGEEDLSSKKMEEFNDNFNRTSEPLFPALEPQNLFPVFYSSYRSKSLQTPFDSLLYLALSLVISYFWRKLQPWKVCLDVFLQKIYIGNARYLKILNSDRPLKSRQN